MVITLTLVVELTNHVQHSFEAISKNQFAVIVVINKHNVSFFKHSLWLSRERDKMRRPDSTNLMNQQMNQSKASQKMSLIC